MKQTVTNFCVRCETRFGEWSAYHAHVTGTQCVRRILPVNVSGRSKSEIVGDWENQNKERIIQ